jgi:conjugal transfer pilus assembly protein TraW
MLIAGSSARAAVVHDLGTFGETYPVQEPDIIAELQQKAARAHDPALFERMKTYQPPELHQLPPAKVDRTFLVDMTYTLDRDITDADGRVVYPRGYTFNPLDYISFPGGLVIINAEDPSQVKWFTSSPYFKNHQARLLISGGLAADLIETLQRPVYYLTEDIAERLQLTAVPSLVIQHEDRLQVREFYLAPEAREKDNEGK